MAEKKSPVHLFAERHGLSTLTPKSLKGEPEQRALAAKLTTPNFIPGLTNHSDARNVTRKLIERGFDDEQIKKILFGNWMRIFEQLL